MILPTKAAIGLVSFFIATVSFAQEGVASVYNQGPRVATGARFNPNVMAAASKTLPLGSYARVTNLKTGQSATVVINDRGPFIRGRIIDLTPASARALGIHGLGRVRVTLAFHANK